VIDYINQNLDRSPSLDELSRIACFSSFHFHRIFVSVVGETVLAYTNRLRLEKSIRLLQYSSLNVSTISIQCGYSSPATFTRAFKSQFGYPPSALRKNRKLEISKICKEEHPVLKYLVPMTREEQRNRFPVRVEKIPKYKVAYIRVMDSFKEGVVMSAFEELISWTQSVGIFDKCEFFGMSLDDPTITNIDLYRYEACVRIPEDEYIKPENDIQFMNIDEGLYAITSVRGDLSLAANANFYLYSQWLVESDYEPDHKHGIEIFRDRSKVLDWSSCDFDLCVPIKKVIS